MSKSGTAKRCAKTELSHRCLLCKKPAWWHLQNKEARGDDGHALLNITEVNRALSNEAHWKGTLRQNRKKPSRHLQIIARFS